MTRNHTFLMASAALCFMAKAGENQDDQGGGGDVQPPAADPTPAPGAAAPAAADANQPGILPKLSLKTVGCNAALAKRDGDEGPAKRLLQARFWGTASGVKAAVGQDGDAVFGLTGNFRAMNMTTSKVYQSGILYLPSGIQDLIQDAVETAMSEGDKKPNVEFAIEIYAVTASNKAGYSFAAETPMAPAINPAMDRLGNMFGEVKPAAPAIAAPTT